MLMDMVVLLLRGETRNFRREECISMKLICYAIRGKKQNYLAKAVLKYSITRAFCIAFILTFISIFDVPVCWPILLFYWIVLCMLTLRRQIEHMIKYKYVPFSFGKRRYDGKRAASTEPKSLPPEV